MRFGIISFAHMHAYSYARVLTSTPGVELVGINDADAARGKQAAEHYGTRYFERLDDLFAAPVDCVVICSPNAEHKEHAIAAARAGKHILCEKPIATRIEDAQAMIRAAEEHGVVLQTAFPVRHADPIRRLKERLDAGDIGEIFGINATNHGKMPPGWFLDKAQAGGGAVMDHTVHVVDAIRWLLGTEVARVYAEVDTLLHDVPIDDCGILTMNLEQGAIVSLNTSWSRPASFPTWGDVTMEIVGTKGAISVDVFAQAGIVYSDQAMRRGEPSAQFHGWGNDTDRAMVEAFLAAVRGEPNAGATGYDGLKAMEVALGAYRSAELGKPVELPLA